MQTNNSVRKLSLKYIIKWLEAKDKTYWVKQKLTKYRKEYRILLKTKTT